MWWGEPHPTGYGMTDEGTRMKKENGVKDTADKKQDTDNPNSVFCVLLGSPCGLYSVFVSSLPFIATAAMLSVIQPPFDISALAWVAMVPLILAASPEANPRRLFIAGYIGCLCYWMVSLYWLVPVTIAGWIVFCFYTAFLWPVLVLCLRWCRTKRVPLFIAAAVLIVGVERMQGIFLGGFFWRFLGHSQYRNITIIQISDIFGAGGVSFLIAMVNGLLAELILCTYQMTKTDGRLTMRAASIVTNPSSMLRLLISFVLVASSVIGTIAYGRWRISQESRCVRPGPMTASLQSNVPQSVKRSFESSEDLFDGLMEKSKAAVQAKAELIVWPETMVQATLNPEVLRLLDPSHSWNIFDKRLSEHAKDSACLLVGAYGGTTEITDDLRINLVEKFNSAFLYDKNGKKAREVYSKIHLVPFGEVLPLRKSMSWFYEILMKIKFIPYNFDYSLDYGTEYTVFRMAAANEQEKESAYKFGVIICYEGTVPSIARKFALDEHGNKKVDWLVNISNDGWFVRFEDGKVLPSAELPQHAAVYAFRAVENRLAILRSVNTGISCLIDSSGRIREGYSAGTLPRQAMARTGMAGWFMDRIPVDSRTTFFSKYGEWLDFCCEAAVILLIIGLIWAKYFAHRFRKPRLSGTDK